jgi:hypothetical protein
VRSRSNSATKASIPKNIRETPFCVTIARQECHLIVLRPVHPVPDDARRQPVPPLELQPALDPLVRRGDGDGPEHDGGEDRDLCY